MNPRFDRASRSARKAFSHSGITFLFWFSESASEGTLVLRREREMISWLTAAGDSICWNQAGQNEQEQDTLKQ